MSSYSPRASIDVGCDLPLTMPALWRRQAALSPGRLLLANDDERLTYAEAETRSRRLARGLIAAGAQKGSHIGLLHPNGADFIVGFLAAARIGAVTVPLSTLSTAHELRWLLDNNAISLLLSAPGYRSHDYGRLLQGAVPELDLSRPAPVTSVTTPWLRRIYFTGQSPEDRHQTWSSDALERLGDQVSDAYLDAVQDRVTPADHLCIINTSGSTAHPKGVIHTHGALIKHVDNINQVRRFTSDDAIYSPPPWFWISGFAFALLGAIVAGGRIINSNSSSASATLDLLERERPTLTNGYPSSVARLTADPSFERRDLSSIRGGTLHPIMPPPLRPRDPDLRHGSYGMTEVGSALTMSGDIGDLPEHQRGSLGKVLPGFDVKIVDRETGRTCSSGEVGELWIRGPLMMAGYNGRLRSDVFDPDGWWPSGDLGHFDADGYYYLTGRTGDMIKTSGANVAPREVEAAIRELTGGRECYVFGLPDARAGQIVVAVVVSTSGEAVNEAKLRSDLENRLSKYKVPRRIFDISDTDLPTLSSGKVDSRKLKAVISELI